MATPLPHPPASQIAYIRGLVTQYQDDARQALDSGNTFGYQVAMSELRVCQNWLDTYVDRRKDAA